MLQTLTRYLSGSAWLALFFLCVVLFTGCTPSHNTPRARIAIPDHSTAAVTETRKSVVIYPAGFLAAAQSFSYLHQEFGGAEAILVSLEEIAAAPLPTENIRIPFRGWENERPKRISIKNYDFQLSKKIIAYLRDLEKREDILAVLLLGDGGLIPPSYYFHVPYLKRMTVADKNYNEWIASDLLYASPDFDLAHEWAVGRISVDTPEEAQQVAEKQYRSALENRQNLDKPLIYFAGNIRQDIIFSGELLYMLFVLEGLIDADAKHYFESGERFTIQHLKNSFAGDEARIHYIFTHGTGDGFEIDNDFLYSDQIAAMPYKNGLPLIVSPSCMDGGFDYDLIDVPHDRDGYSIGEAILRAPGAGIGYLGSSRISLGQFHFNMKNGELDPEGIFYRYMPGLLMDFLTAYHNGTHRIGDAYVEAHRRYRERFTVLTPQDFATFVELTLLADPVMILPEPPTIKSSGKLDHLQIQSRHGLKKRMPFVPKNEPIRYALHENSSYDSVAVMVIDTRSGRIVAQERIRGKEELQFTVNTTSSYLMRLDFDDGTISWQYFLSGLGKRRQS